MDPTQPLGTCFLEGRADTPASVPKAAARSECHGGGGLGGPLGGPEREARAASTSLSQPPRLARRFPPSRRTPEGRRLPPVALREEGGSRSSGGSPPPPPPRRRSAVALRPRAGEERRGPSSRAGGVGGEMAIAGAAGGACRPRPPPDPSAARLSQGAPGSASGVVCRLSPPLRSLSVQSHGREPSRRPPARHTHIHTHTRASLFFLAGIAAQRPQRDPRFLSRPRKGTICRASRLAHAY